MRLPRTNSKTSLVAFFLVVTSPLVYVLSYAPVVRLQEGADPQTYPTEFVLFVEYQFYDPVEWLIDNTPLEQPLIRWAGIWGVGTAFENARIWRYNSRIRELRSRYGPNGIYLSEDELLERAESP